MPATKFIRPAVIDLVVDEIVNASNGVKLHICTSAVSNPPPYAAASSGATHIATYTLSGELTGSNPTATTARLTCAQITGITAAAAGTAEVIVISNGSSVIYYVAVISPGVVIAVGNSITVNAFTYTISQIA